MADRNDRRILLLDLIDRVCDIKRDITRSFEDEVWTEEERVWVSLARLMLDNAHINLDAAMKEWELSKNEVRE
jgi:hypothetical protein